MLSAFITGLEGPDLTPREAAFLREACPCGVILFARNATDPDQLRRLTDAAKAAVGEEILILIDQEGGRVQRLRPPHWRALPAAAAYGQAVADSHFDLPVVTATREELEATDFVPFRKLAYLPAAMTAHVVFTAFDTQAPASISKRVTEEAIRGVIGFSGLLMSDDLGMKALSGTVEEKARAVLAAGSDVVLACNGGLAESEAVASVAPAL